MCFHTHRDLSPSFSTPERRQTTSLFHSFLLSKISGGHCDKWLENVPWMLLVQLEKLFLLYFSICLVDCFQNAT